MHSDQGVHAVCLQIDGRTDVSDSPASLVRLRTKCCREKRPNLGIARQRKQEPHAVLVLNVAPFTAEGWQPVRAHSATAISHGMLKQELACVSMAYGVSCVLAALHEAQATESQ